MDVTLEATIAATPETVFSVITDHSRYSEFTPLRSSKLEVEGKPEPGGVGAIRAFGIAGPPMRERVTAYEAPKRMSYELISGAPLKNHRGEIELEPAGEGTRVRYSVHSEPKIPLIGHLAMPIVRQSIKALFSGLKGEAERRARQA